MRVKGIHYDIGTLTLESGLTRPTLDPRGVRRELRDIQDGLQANAVRITGSDLDRLRSTAEIAAGLGLEIWLSPMLPNADRTATLAAVEGVASIAEELRRTGSAVTLVVGCELSAFMLGIIPGTSQADRLSLLTDLPRLIAEVTAAGYDPQERFDAWLADAVRTARATFAGSVTYASGTWEQVDWSRFDVVGIDAYRDAGNRGGYPESLQAYASYDRPVVVTETGCATFRGAADLGSLAWTSVDRSTQPRSLKAGVIRDEAEQATEVGAVLDLIEASGAEGAFVYTYVAPSYPSSDDPTLDLDAAAYALVRSWPDGRSERKAAFSAVAERYGRDRS